MSQNKYQKKALEIANLVTEKQKAYGESFYNADRILEVLYPDGIRKEQYADFLAITRIIDKLFRLANQKHAFEESPWQDIIGYALLASCNGPDWEKFEKSIQDVDSAITLDESDLEEINWQQAEKIDWQKYKESPRDVGSDNMSEENEMFFEKQQENHWQQHKEILIKEQEKRKEEQKLTFEDMNKIYGDFPGVNYDEKLKMFKCPKCIGLDTFCSGCASINVGMQVSNEINHHPETVHGEFDSCSDVCCPICYQEDNESEKE